MFEATPLLTNIAEAAGKAVVGAIVHAAAKPVVRSAWRSIRGMFAKAPAVEPELVFTTTLPGCDGPIELEACYALRTLQPGEIVRFKDGGAFTRVFTSLIYEDDVERIRIDHDLRKNLYPADEFESVVIDFADVRNSEACPLCAVQRSKDGNLYHDAQPFVHPGPILCHDCGSLHSVWPVYPE